MASVPDKSLALNVYSIYAHPPPPPPHEFVAPPAHPPPAHHICTKTDFAPVGFVHVPSDINFCISDFNA